MAESDTEWMYTRGAVVDAEKVFILSFPRLAEDSDAEITQLLRWTRNSLGNFMFPWGAMGLAIVREPYAVVVAGPHGNVAVAVPGGMTEEVIDTTNEGPGARGLLRDIRAIGSRVYVAGMGRQVYRRETTGVWARFDDGVVTPLGSGEVVGFNSIDGFSEDEIYAAGWNGEIWIREQGNWRKIESLTNVKLERIVCAADGNAYAVGQTGTILCGRGQQWTLVNQKTTTEQFWGACWYRERLWLATNRDVFILNPENELEKVDLSLGPDKTCGWLDNANGVLWSFGANHLAYTSNGTEWTQVFTGP